MRFTIPSSFFYTIPWNPPFSSSYLVINSNFFSLVSDLPDNATDLIGEGSVHPSQYDEDKLDWLLNLDIDHDTAEYQPATPVSVPLTIPSTPALPAEVEISDHTASPPRFSPEPRGEFDGEGTVSDQTYNDICEYCHLKSSNFFSSHQRRRSSIISYTDDHGSIGCTPA